MLELATTRPETMLGDTAVAINAADPRYAHLHGCHVLLPLANREIPIICDEHADMEKGTGVVKITPAHDPNDNEVGQRHNLPVVRVFTYDGHMTGAEDAAKDADGQAIDCGKYAGMTTLEARKAIVADLQELGLLKSIEPLTHEVGTCYRCHTVIEPMVSRAVVREDEAAGETGDRGCAKSGKTQFVPERFTKQLYELDGKHPRLVHQPSALVGTPHSGVVLRRLRRDDRQPRRPDDAAPSAVCAHSSRMRTCWIPGSPLRCGRSPRSAGRTTPRTLKYFYPTNLLVTGYDIITFWVSRMITMRLGGNAGIRPSRRC